MNWITFFFSKTKKWELYKKLQAFKSREEIENYMLHSILENPKKMKFKKQLNSWPGLQVFEVTGYSANFYSTPVSSVLKQFSNEAAFEQTIFKEQQKGRNIIAWSNRTKVSSFKKALNNRLTLAYWPLASFVKISFRKPWSRTVNYM